MQYAWRPTGKDRRPTFAILVVRVSPDPFKVLDETPAVLASATTPHAVNHPALAPGPAGEVLLLYESDEAVDRLPILSRVLREK